MYVMHLCYQLYVTVCLDMHAHLRRCAELRSRGHWSQPLHSICSQSNLFHKHISRVRALLRKYKNMKIRISLSLPLFLSLAHTFPLRNLDAGTIDLAIGINVSQILDMPEVFRFGLLCKQKITFPLFFVPRTI